MPSSLIFFFNDTATTEIYTLSLHDALPIFLQDLLDLAEIAEFLGQDDLVHPRRFRPFQVVVGHRRESRIAGRRSEEHTSELQSPCNLVCRLLLEKKKNYRCADQLQSQLTPT